MKLYSVRQKKIELLSPAPVLSGYFLFFRPEERQSAHISKKTL